MSTTSDIAHPRSSVPLELLTTTGALVEKRPPPPPESLESIRTRSLVVLSFWLVVVLLGLPLWWVTTSIYRAPLPLNEMQRWADGRACRAEFPLLVDVEAPSIPDPEHLLKTVQHALDDANDFSAHHLRLRLSGAKQSSEDEDDAVAATLRLLPGQSGASHTYKLSNVSRTIELYYSPSSSSTNLSAFVASTLQNIFAEEQQMITHLLASTTPSPSPSSAGIANGNSGTNNGAMTRKMSRILQYSPTYHLTFSIFTASGAPSSWEIEEAVTSYFQPLLGALSGISNFTVDSQIQFYASLSSNVVPAWVSDEPSTNDQPPEPNSVPGKWVLEKEDLSSFINSAEWPLVSITNYPTINFIVYIPEPQQTPLYISSSATNSFLLPQWGGVMILNPSTRSPPAALTKHDLKPALDIFAAQLLSLLGAPSHPQSLPIRLDSLTRQRSAELLVSASSTLGSLYRLTLALPSISIPSSVSVSVGSTLSSLNNACRELKRGSFGGPGGALEEGRNAAAQAEKAFFEKSMVGQVYFPEEHKVAVYLPLMGPVGVPLIMYAVKELGRIVREWRALRSAKS